MTSELDKEKGEEAGRPGSLRGDKVRWHRPGPARPRPARRWRSISWVRAQSAEPTFEEALGPNRFPNISKIK